MLKELEGKGIVDITKKDMDEAAKHGILKPPPEGAGKIKRLFHQAKELFVRDGCVYISRHGFDRVLCVAEILRGWVKVCWHALEGSSSDPAEGEEWRTAVDMAGA